ncbi:hypothetical protein QMN71_23200, partial [Escherichia coli]|uniref:hypothetical protein n=1 Tax=Escherichia coli TaxID=562 RepID=UPI0024AEF40E
AWWRQAGRLGPEKFLAQAEKAMAEGWVSLRDVPQSQESAHGNDEWIKVLKTAQQYPSNWEKRKEILGDDLFEALKRTGSI